MIKRSKKDIVYRSSPLKFSSGLLRTPLYVCPDEGSSGSAIECLKGQLNSVNIIGQRRSSKVPLVGRASNKELGGWNMAAGVWEVQGRLGGPCSPTRNTRPSWLPKLGAGTIHLVRFLYLSPGRLSALLWRTSSRNELPRLPLVTPPQLITRAFFLPLNISPSYGTGAPPDSPAMSAGQAADSSDTCRPLLNTQLPAPGHAGRRRTKPIGW